MGKLYTVVAGVFVATLLASAARADGPDISAQHLLLSWVYPVAVRPGASGLTSPCLWVSDIRRFDIRSVFSGGSEGMMITLVLELYGGVLACSTVAFLVIALASKSPE